MRLVDGSRQSWDADTSFSEKEPFGLSLLKNSDCFNCHNFSSRLIGPSFQEIAERYSGKSSDDIARHITDGSRGIWGQVVMPSHPEISADHAKQITRWIIKNGLNKNVNYLRGQEGSFRIAVPPDARRGIFVLHATYTDSGLHGRTMDGLTGEDFVIAGYQ